MKPFTEKYSPKTIKGIVGQDESLKQLSDFVVNYQKQKKKAAFIYGPTGSGKTCSAHAIGKGLNLEIIEVNASDFRNADGINSILGGALRQQSLFSVGKLILVDEVDGLAGNPDRGGV